MKQILAITRKGFCQVARFDHRLSLPVYNHENRVTTGRAWLDHAALPPVASSKWIGAKHTS